MVLRQIDRVAIRMKQSLALPGSPRRADDREDPESAPGASQALRFGQVDAPAFAFAMS